MPNHVIYTDDEARGLKFEYLGPDGVDMPPARPAAYGVLAGFTLVGWAFTWLLAPAGWFVIGGVVLSPLVAAYWTKRLMPNVDYYRPVRHWLSVWRSELNAPRRTLEQSRVDTETTLDPRIFKKGNHR